LHTSFISLAAAKIHEKTVRDLEAQLHAAQAELEDERSRAASAQESLTKVNRDLQQDLHAAQQLVKDKTMQLTEQNLRTQELEARIVEQEDRVCELVRERSQLQIMSNTLHRLGLETDELRAGSYVTSAVAKLAHHLQKASYLLYPLSLFSLKQRMNV
jgi:acyl-homoserine lactone acylase PvdQ